jgi:hypothetical protein
VLTVDGVNDPLLGERVHSSVGQGGSHDRHILGSHVQRALLGVNVRCLERIEVDPVVALEQAGDALVPLVGSCLGLIYLAVKGKASSGELGQPVLNELPLCIGSRTRRQAGSRNCPGIHHRVRRSVAGPLDAHNRIKRQPRTVHPKFLARLVFS